eukprot:6609016-Alexandrium_andersonii.AAC.1
METGHAGDNHTSGGPSRGQSGRPPTRERTPRAPRPPGGEPRAQCGDPCYSSSRPSSAAGGGREAARPARA